MADTSGFSYPLRALLAAVSVAALALGLLPLAPGAHATSADQPSDESDGAGTAATANEAETAQNADSPIEFERQAGATRFQTAAEIATARFDASTDVVIATGEDYADALAGAGLEGTLEAPVLLVPSDLINGSIPSAITDAIDDLGATSATLLGGEDAISTGVADHIVDNSTVTTTERVEGPTRFETAEEIANQVSASPVPTDLQDLLDIGDGNVAFVATGLEFADALAAGAGAYEGPHPILLTGPDELHPAAERGLEASGADTVIILGGNAAVGSDVQTDLENEGYETERLAGANRWETATEVADAFADGFGFDVADVGLATGFEFADALASAPYLGEVPAPLVLTPGNETHDAPEAWFDARGCDIETLHVFGGQVAVQDSVAESYAEAACPAETGPETMTVEVEPETQTVTETATATATVTGDDGEPFEGATVDFTTDHSEGGAVAPASGSDDTDASGEATFDFTTPETGTVTITAEADGLQEEADATFVDQFRIEEASRDGADAAGLAYTQPLQAQGDRPDGIAADQFFLVEGTDVDDLDPDDAGTFAQQPDAVTITDPGAGELEATFATDLASDTDYTLAYVEDTDADVRVKNPDGDDALSPDSATLATAADALLSGESVEDLQATGTGQDQDFTFTVEGEPIGAGDVVTIDVSAADDGTADYSGASVDAAGGAGTAAYESTTDSIVYTGVASEDAVDTEITITLQGVDTGAAEAGLDVLFERESYSNTVSFDVTG